MSGVIDDISQHILYQGTRTPENRAAAVNRIAMLLKAKADRGQRELEGQGVTQDDKDKYIASGVFDRAMELARQVLYKPACQVSYLR